jgi:chemosensory pili system protein ChpA (sensor histidine kinase/response regulator)
MTDNYDQLALSWVRKEINNTLEQARQGLETFADDNHDQTQIQFCINCLHQVQGTLQMLGFEGAARLASEMERLAEKMAKQSDSLNESSFEVLMRSMMQMPGYLERVESGQKDIPVILLPLINELRSQSGLGPVNENEFFVADTGDVEPPKPNEPVSAKEKSLFQENAKKLRAHFQKGLAGVIRGQSVKESLSRIHKVLLRLEALTEGHSVARLWWIADGFIFSVAEKGLYKKKEVHVLLSQVDRQIKRIAENGEEALGDKIPKKLLSKLLYFVARSNSRNQRVLSLKKEFNLAQALPESETIKKQQQQLARPDSNAMASVVTAIGEELASVKDQLDLFVRAQAKEPSQLQALYESLVRIADTLTILELPIPRDVIREQIRTLQRAIDLEKMPDDSSIMDIAGALLFVDANLSNFDLDRFETAKGSESEEENAEIGEQRSKESQVDDATVALVGVARKNLQLAKDGMINYIAASFNIAELEKVPALLNEVMGAMRIVEFNDAAEVLDIAESFVQSCLNSPSETPGEQYLDALADIVTSVDYYLEGTEEGNNKAIVSILRSAKPSQDLLSEALLSRSQPPVVAVDNSTESADAITEQEPSNVVELPEESVETIAASAPVVQNVVKISAEKPIDKSLIDEEVLEIFLEEAEEEIEVIENTLPVWINDVHNKEALSTIRRSLHTFKGSGRLVGANTISEMSWALENLLNKVIEDTVPAENPVFGILNDALGKLPTLVKEFSTQTAHEGDDIVEIIARADFLSQGGRLSDFVFGLPTDSVEPEQAMTAEPAVEEEPIDPVLLEIFVAEAQAHLKVINDFIEVNTAAASVAVSDDLIRALHTLKGSAHMAKVITIARISGPLEQYARVTKGGNRRFEPELMALLSDVSEYLVKAVANLKDFYPVEDAEFETLMVRIDSLSGASAKSSESDGQVKQRDQQLVSIFLTEGSDILQEVGVLLEASKASPSDFSINEKISSEFHAFKRGSEMVGISEIQRFATTCELVSQITFDSNDTAQEYRRLLNAGVDALSGMLSRLVSEEDMYVPEELDQEMQSWILETSRVDAPEEMDQELVELFVEEADELLESLEGLLNRWKEHVESADITKELRRIYHTFKGSSRMAGAMNIGDLGYAIEEIFNTHVDFGRALTGEDVTLVDMATEKLIEMVNVLRNFRWPEPAPIEINRIEVHLNPDTVELLVIDEPSVDTVEEISVEVAEQATVDDSDQDSEAVEEDITLLSNVEEIQSDSEDEIPTLETSVDESEVEAFENELQDSVEDVQPTEVIASEFDIGEISIDDELDISSSIEIEEIEEIEGIEEIEEISNEMLEQETDGQTDIVDADDAEEILIEENLTEQPTEPVESLETTDSTVSEEELLEEEEAAEQDPEEASNLDEVNVLPVQARKESSDATHTEDTIGPAAPMVASGNIYTIDLDEDGQEVLEIYLEEADELLITLDEAMHAWSEDNSNTDAIDTMQRAFHTFKGGARLADLVVLGDLTHEMETYFELVNAGTLEVKPSHVNCMLQGYDVIEALVNEVKNEHQMTVPEAYFNNLKLIIAGEEPTDLSADDSVVVDEVDSSEEEVVVASKPSEPASSVERAGAEIVSFEKRKQEEEDKRKATSAPVDTVRVNSNQLENLVNLAGETSIFRSRLEQQMTVLRYNLDEMSATVERLKDQLRNLDIETEAQISYRREISGGTEYEDFDPLEMDRYTRQQELTRSLGESAVDLVNLKETLDFLTSDSETLLLQQGRVNTEMQESLMQTRMTPFDSLVPRLRRMVRQISTELGKTIELSISADGEMDRSVLERMVAPLEHMLRNAMDHGIESPADRKAAKKSETGKIIISLFREGSEVFIKIKDDGRGLNLTAIREKALERGLITKETDLNEHELQQLILEAGFSTAEQVTQISGRGVGMDVVNSEIKQLGGVIEIDSEQGVGSVFTVRLPFTVSVNQALMVQIGEEVYAIPLSNIEGIVRVSPFELEEYYSDSDTKFAYAGIDYSMYYLGQMLDHHTKANLAGVSQPLPVLLLHGADHPTALQVDDLLGSREIVVKSIGSQLSSVSGLSGATIQGDGRVVLILDMPALIRRVDAQIGEVFEPQEVVEEQKIPTVMVVDDSITVRKVTTRLLERHEFEVITAKDGVDAVTVLADTVPDVMLLDIEMPRMDGFELATIIRHDDRLKGIPIIMITSRTGEKHRERAEAIGVNQYMGKPYNEVDLLETINGLLTDNS